MSPKLRRGYSRTGLPQGGPFQYLDHLNFEGSSGRIEPPANIVLLPRGTIRLTTERIENYPLAD